MKDVYDTESMAYDIADAVDEVLTSAVLSETFTTTQGADGHAFLLDTPSGRRFKVTVTEVETGL